MRLPRVRFTVRRIMVAVAVAALFPGGDAARRRWAVRSSFYRAKAEESRRNARFLGVMLHIQGLRNDADRDPEGESELKRDIARHREAAGRYERAAARPWLHVEIEPEPESPYEEFQIGCPKISGQPAAVSYRLRSDPKGKVPQEPPPSW